MASNLKIKIRTLKGVPTPKQGEMLDSVNKAVEGLNILQIHGLHDGILLALQSREEIYKLLSTEAQTKLRESKLQAVTPTWLHPSKTLIAIRMPEAITDRKIDEIIKDIRERHPHIGLADALILPNKFQDHRRLKAIKFIFDSTEHAEAALSSGFSVCNFNIPSDQLVKHRNADAPSIIQCFKCFRFDHPTSACREDRIFCSICGRPNHHFKECPTPQEPCCINCGEEHVPVSINCRLKIDLIENIKARKSIAKTSSVPKKPRLVTTEQQQQQGDQESHTYKEEDFPLLKSKKSQEANALVHSKIIYRMTELEMEEDIHQAIRFTEIANKNLIRCGYETLPIPRAPRRRKGKAKDRSHDKEKEKVNALNCQEEHNEPSIDNHKILNENNENNEPITDSQKVLNVLGELPPPPSQGPPIIQVNQQTLSTKKQRKSVNKAISDSFNSEEKDETLEIARELNIHISSQESLITPGQRCDIEAASPSSSLESTIPPGQGYGVKNPMLSPIPEIDLSKSSSFNYESTDIQKEDNSELSYEEESEDIGETEGEDNDEEDDYETSEESDLRSMTTNDNSHMTSPPKSAEKHDVITPEHTQKGKKKLINKFANPNQEKSIITRSQSLSRLDNPSSN